MPVHFTHKPIGSYVDHISLTIFKTAGKKLLQPDGCCDLTVLRRDNGTQVLRLYQSTKPVVIEHEPGDEIVGVSFRPGVFIPSLPHDARSDKGVGLPLFGHRNFLIGVDQFEIPTIENVPVLVQRLIQKGVLQTNPNVAAALDDRSVVVSDRTLQRAFAQSTGLTKKYLTQIKRAQAAINLLQTGTPAVQVASDLGYSDQAHMTNSLKQIMGQTPNQICNPESSVTPWRSSASYILLATFPTG